MILTLIQSLVFTSYIAFIISKFGILSSISESWYKLKGLGGVWYSLFTWFCWILGLLMFFQTNGESIFFFLSGFGLFGVGVATLFKLKGSIEPYIHNIGASFGIIFSLLGLWIERGSFIPLAGFVVSALLIFIICKVFKLKNETWWVEIAAFISILLGLLLF